MQLKEYSKVIIAFAISALLSVGTILYSFANGEIVIIMLYAAPLAAAMLAAPLWWLLLRKKRAYWRALSAGILVSLMSHPLAWYFLFISNWLINTRGSLGDTPVNPLEAMQIAIVFAIWSLMLTGWITAIFGGLTGLLLFSIM